MASSMGQSSQPPSFNAFNNNTNNSLLDDLLENSRKLRQDTKLPDLPSIQLGLGEIERRAGILNAPTSQKINDARAHYLLQATGVQSEDAVRNLETVDIGFDEIPSRATAQAARLDTDIEGYLRTRKEQNIISAIEEGMRRTTQEFETYVANNISLDWDAQKKRIYEHFGLTTKQTTGAGENGSKANDRDMFGQSSFGSTFAGRASTAGGMGSSTFGQSRFAKASLGQLVLGTPPKDGNQTLLFTDTDKANQGAPMTQMYGRQQGYAIAVKKLNEARLSSGNFPVIAHFSEVTKNTQDVITSSLYEAWKMLGSIAGENAANNRIGERAYAERYLQSSYDSNDAVKLREDIERGARSYLEAQFMLSVEDLIARNPAQARVGGVPTAEHKIKAYINIKLLGKDKWKDTTFETVNDYPGWAIVFYMLRGGYLNEAVAYVQNNLDTFSKLERSFLSYITAYTQSPERRLPRNLFDRLHAEYNQRIKFLGEGTDPFKQAVYKIIGRCELQKRTIPEILTSAEDWMWLQLVLTRESSLGDEPAQEVYTFADLKKAVLQFGGKHFGLANSNFGLYFQMLLMAGLFENAVQYLYSFLYVDAVHFAIALSYYGLLQIADDAGGPNVPLLTTSSGKSRRESQQAKINFARLLGYYTQDFRKTNSEEAVDYIALINLNSTLAPPLGETQQKLCHEALRELVLETRDFARLVGDARNDGTRQKGAIELRSKIIGLNDEDDFLRTITSQAAMQADEDDRISDAVLLYHLAEDYDTVVALVGKSLSESLASTEATEVYAGANPSLGLNAQGQPMNQSISLTSVEDPAELARNIISTYSKTSSIYAKVSKANWEALGVLVTIAEAKKLYNEGRVEQCLKAIETMDIIPMGANVDVGSIRRRAQNFGSLHETVARNVPNLLVMSVNCANRIVANLKEGGFVDATRDWKIKDFSARSRNCILFAGMIQYKMPPDVYNQMAALE